MSKWVAFLDDTFARELLDLGFEDHSFSGETRYGGVEMRAASLISMRCSITVVGGPSSLNSAANFSGVKLLFLILGEGNKISSKSILN